MLQVQRRIKNVEILINYKGSRERVRGGGPERPPSLLAYQTRRLFETKILTSALFNWLIFSMKRALHFATKLNYTVKRGSVSNIRLLPRAKMLFVPTIFFLWWADYAPGRRGTLGISGWGCAAGTLEPLSYTRASSAEFCYPILE